MNIEIGSGLATILTSAITTFGGVLVLWLTNRAEFKKAQIAREHTAVDLARKTQQSADDLEQKASVLAIEAAAKAETLATEVRQRIDDDGAKKDVKLSEIHNLVNSRLTKALDEISELKKTIGGLIAAGGQGLTKEETVLLRTQAATQVNTGEQSGEKQVQVAVPPKDEK